ncbi:hypothetical protein Tco_0247869 [Tanacetum coccineum]
MGSIDDIKSTLTQSALDALCEKFHILDVVHPELPGHNNRIHVLEYFQINLSQLSVIAAAKVSHFEILCRVHGFVLAVGYFHRFYIISKNKGWMSFSKRSETAPVCYTKPLGSLKHWNNNFFWVDCSAFPVFVLWHNNKILKKDPHPTPTEFNAEVCEFLATHPAPFWKFLKSFLCLVGISRYYELDDNVYPVFLADDDEEMDLFAFIHHADPTKVRIGEKQIKEGHVPLLESTRGRVVPLAGVNEQGNQNDDVEDDGNQNDDVQDDGNNDEVLTTVVNKPKGTRKKRKIASGGSGSALPPKRLREDYGTSGDAGASTPRKSLTVLQDLFNNNTLAAEVGATAAVTVPFVTSSVTPIPERESGDRTDSIIRPNLRTQHPAERFVISSDYSHHFNANAADDEVTSIVRSSVPPPPILTAAVVTTTIVGTTSALVHEPAEANVVGPSQPVGAEFNVGVAHQACFSAEVRLRSEHNYRERNKFERKCQRQIDLLKERDTEIANLKAHLSLKESKAAEAIRLRSQVAAIEGTEAARVDELNDLSDLGLSCDELCVKASSLKAERDRLVGQVSLLEGTCSKPNDEVSGYKLFKEQIEAVLDEQVKVLSDKVAELESDLMGMALHLDEEFYPYFLTTIAEQRWILGRGLRLVVMKCLQSLEYLAALGGEIGHAIDKGMQDGLAEGIDVIPKVNPCHNNKPYQ